MARTGTRDSARTGIDDRARGGPPRRRGAEGAARLEGLLGARPQGRAARARAHRGREARRAEVTGRERTRARRLCSRGRSSARTGRDAPARLPILRALLPTLVLVALVLASALAACAPRATIPDAERERVSAGARRPAALPPRRGVRRAVLGDRAEAAPHRSAARASSISSRRPAARPSRRPRRSACSPPGTPVRVREVEFPTGWLIAKPRGDDAALPPVGLRRGRRASARPLVIVLSQTAATFDDVRAELEQILSADDPGLALPRAAEEQRAAIAQEGARRGDEPARARDGVGPPGEEADRPSRRDRGVDLARREAPRVLPGRAARALGAVSRPPDRGAPGGAPPRRDRRRPRAAAVAAAATAAVAASAVAARGGARRGARSRRVAAARARAAASRRSRRRRRCRPGAARRGRPRSPPDPGTASPPCRSRRATPCAPEPPTHGQVHVVRRLDREIVRRRPCTRAFRAPRSPRGPSSVKMKSPLGRSIVLSYGWAATATPPSSRDLREHLARRPRASPSRRPAAAPGPCAGSGKKQR